MISAESRGLSGGDVWIQQVGLREQRATAGSQCTGQLCPHTRPAAIDERDVAGEIKVVGFERHRAWVQRQELDVFKLNLPRRLTDVGDRRICRGYTGFPIGKRSSQRPVFAAEREHVLSRSNSVREQLHPPRPTKLVGRAEPALEPRFVAVGSGSIRQVVVVGWRLMAGRLHRLPGTVVGKGGCCRKCLGGHLALFCVFTGVVARWLL